MTKTLKKKQNMSIVNNKNTRATSMMSLWRLYYLRTYFLLFSSVFTADFELLNFCWVYSDYWKFCLGIKSSKRIRLSNWTILWLFIDSLLCFKTSLRKWIRSNEHPMRVSGISLLLKHCQENSYFQKHICDLHKQLPWSSFAKAVKTFFAKKVYLRCLTMS